MDGHTQDSKGFCVQARTQRSDRKHYTHGIYSSVGRTQAALDFLRCEQCKHKKANQGAAEEEEYESYNGRMPEEWLQDLAPLQTDWHKEFLEVAPWLIIVFKRIYEPGEGGKKKNNYYVQESVGLACGFLLTAIHHAGLVALTHTPSPMNFLSKILNRPEHEKPFLLIPVGYPAPDCLVPDLKRKSLDEVAVFYE